MRTRILRGEYPEEFRAAVLGSFSPGEVGERSHSRVLLATQALYLRHAKRLSPVEISEAIGQRYSYVRALIAGKRTWRLMGERTALAHYQRMLSGLPYRRRYLARFFLQEYKRNRGGDYTDPVTAAAIARQARDLLSSGRVRGRRAWLGLSPEQARQYAKRIRAQLPPAQSRRVVAAFLAAWRGGRGVRTATGVMH